jgi:transposase
MYIECVPNRNSPPAVLLRESYREDGKIRKRTVGNLSHLPTEVIERLKAALKGEVIPATQGLADPEASILLSHSRPHGHVAAIHAVMAASGLIRTIDPRPSRERDIVIAMVIDRMLNGDSKLSTARHCRTDTATTTLGEILSLGDLDEHECYRAMDWLLERQGRIEKKLAAKHLVPDGSVLYDLSSSYFEGHTCPLAKLGYSRDRRSDLPQVNYGLYCNEQGVPVAVDVLPGSENDHVAFPLAVKRVREDFGHSNIIFVGDRGMISGKAIDEYLRGKEGADWITALTNSAIAKLANGGHIQMSLFDERDLAVIEHPDYPSERLVVCRNQLLLAERRRKREELLQVTEKRLQDVSRKVSRARKPLRGKEKIGVEVGKVVNKGKMQKHFVLTITDDSFEFARDEQKIAREAALDGLYVIRSSVTKDRMSAEQLVTSYKQLAMVERAFRSIKSIDIRVRPIHHRLEPRVRAHIFLCMLACYVEHAMRERLTPLLFIDEEKPAASERASVVAPAPRSAKAIAKDSTRQTCDGKFPIASFRDIIGSLSALCRATVHIKGHQKNEFRTTTKPTPYQHELLRLLGAERHL